MRCGTSDDAQVERYYRSRFAVIQRTPSCCDTTGAQTERPTVGVPTPPSGSPEEKSTELPKREKTSLFTQ